MLGAFSSSRALRDAVGPMPSSLSRPREPTRRVVLSIAPADASALRCLCWFHLSVKPARAHGSALCAVCTQPVHSPLIMCLP